MNGIVWQRSSFCGGGGNNCVEIAELLDGIAIRDSVYPDRVMAVGRSTLSAFIRHVRADEGNA
ncbi:DUF397 domain-containing protein [Streptomyces sp. NBC_01233]|uniref:DUF397 domain-containing protein n=1 Tax=Streptomyces sp. NBC_01233 TaxID=2903787 RepID=UPI002E1516FD|nr:DUF397 domain-containing protein [Streptomyces sp. NBC_01233]